DLPVLFRCLRAHTFPSASEFLDGGASAGTGLGLGGAQKGLLFFSGAVGKRGQYFGRGQHLVEAASEQRRRGAGVALILYMVARLHVLPYFKARDAMYLAKLHSLPWRGLLEFCASEPLFGHWALRFVQDAVASALPEVFALLQPRPSAWREDLDPAFLSPVTLSRVCAGDDLRLKQLFAEVAITPFTANTWTALRTRSRLATWSSSSISSSFSSCSSCSPSGEGTLAFSPASPPSALEIFAFARTHLRKLWIDLDPAADPCTSALGSPTEEELCLLLETWRLYSSLEPSVACLALATELIVSFLPSSSSSTSSSSFSFPSSPSSSPSSSSSLGNLFLHASSEEKSDEKLGRVNGSERTARPEGRGLPFSVVAPQYFNVCQNFLNLLLRVPAAVLFRLLAFNVLPDTIYFFLLKMESYVFMGAPVLPGFPQAFFDPEEILASQEAAVFQVLLEVCRLALPSASVCSSRHDAAASGACERPAKAGKEKRASETLLQARVQEAREIEGRNWGVWELLCGIFDRQLTRRPQALQLLFSEGFPLDSVNPVCRFLQQSQLILPLCVAALKEAVAVIWRASEASCEAPKQDPEGSNMVASYERFVRLPAKPSSLSVHPALAPLTVVDRCLFYFKCITCVACDLRDNEALKREVPETNPAFAAESANAVLLESVKRIDDQASEDLCELVGQAIPIVFPLYYLFPKLAVLVSAFLSRRRLLTGETTVAAPPQKDREDGEPGRRLSTARAFCEAVVEQLETDLHRIVQYDMQAKVAAPPVQGEEEAP
ncbi:hypothetical protein TGPRC2_224510B, partial [Toxoplasma gondii TgCatPRC2]